MSPAGRKELARIRAADVIGCNRGGLLNAAGLAVIDTIELVSLRATLASLAEAVEYHCVLDEPSPRMRAALDAAWAVLGDKERRAARMRAGYCECGGQLDDPQHDVCARCARRKDP